MLSRRSAAARSGSNPAGSVATPANSAASGRVGTPVLDWSSRQRAAASAIGRAPAKQIRSALLRTATMGRRAAERAARSSGVRVSVKT